ncbi:unnamed protein product, partial [Choristocarpus tenellus]
KVYAQLLALGIREIEIENNNIKEASLSGNETPQGIGSTDQEEYLGWVIEDFPGTAKQAAELEKCLSGYDGDAHIPSRLDKASQIAEANPILVKGGDEVIVPSGIDLVLFIEAPKELIFRRSLGRMFDPLTGNSYHFENSLPHYDVVCKERLVRPEDPASTCSHLALQLSTQATDELKAFLKRFRTLRIVESTGMTADALFGVLNTIVSSVFLNVKERQEISQPQLFRGDEQPVPDSTEKMAETADGVEASTLQEEDGNGEGNDDLQKVHDKICISDGVAGRKGLEDQSIGIDEADKNEGNKGEIREAFMSGEMAAALAGHWDVAEKQFQETVRQVVFRELRNQRYLVSTHIRQLKDSFLVCMTRPDDKQRTITAFCLSFNSIDQDLRFKECTQMELLLQAEECRDSLWKEVEDRKTLASKILSEICNDGWVERQVGMVFNHFMLLMQAEVERFHAGMSLLHDYHHSCVQGSVDGKKLVLSELLSEPGDGKDGMPQEGTTDKEKKTKKKGKGKDTGKDTKARGMGG